MHKSYLYIRETGINGTKILETTRKHAVSIIKENRRTGYQLGILGGRNLGTIKSVYGEFAPFIKVESEEELLECVR